MEKVYNLRQYIENIAQENEVKRLIENYRNLSIMYASQLKEYYGTCIHELVIRLGKEHKYAINEGYAICMQCGKDFFLDTRDKDEKIDSDAIINVDGLLPDELTTTCVSGENVVVARAKNMLARLAATTPTLEINDLKQNILEDLIFYTDELGLTESPQRRVRIFDTK